MRFLKGLKKTPDELENESEDEFDAEESGLLMSQPPPGDRGEPVRAGASDGEATPAGPEAEPESERDVSATGVSQSLEGEEDALSQLADSSPAPSEEQETATEGMAVEQGSRDSPLDLFRASSASQHAVAPALTENLEDLSAVDLLAQALSVRDIILGRQAAGARSENEPAA